MFKNIIYLAIVIFLSGCANSSDQYLSHLKTSVQYQKEGKYEFANEELQKAIELNPNSELPHRLLSLNYLGIKNYSKALEFNLNAIRLSANDSEKIQNNNEARAQIYLNRALKYEVEKNYQMAIKDLTSIIELNYIGNTRLIYAYKNRSNLYKEIGDLANEIKDAEKACSLGDCNLISKLNPNKKIPFGFKNFKMGMSEKDIRSFYSSSMLLDCTPVKENQKFCFTSLLGSGTIANKQILKTYFSFLNDELKSIQLISNSHNYEDISSALENKNGRPTNTRVISKQNQMGSSFSSKEKTWLLEDGIIIIEEIGDQIDTMKVQYISNDYMQSLKKNNALNSKKNSNDL